MEARVVNEGEDIPVIPLAVSPSVAPIVLTFIYADRVEIPPELALDTLFAADLLLLDRLKSLAAISLTNCRPEDLPIDMYSILRAAWQTRVERLEQFAARFFADNLESYIYEKEFSDIVLESANRIAGRQETDTLELIDDIRFYLGQRYGIIFEDDVERSTGKIQETAYITQYEREYNSKLELIDQLLEGLQLDA